MRIKEGSIYRGDVRTSSYIFLFNDVGIIQIDLVFAFTLLDDEIPDLRFSLSLKSNFTGDKMNMKTITLFSSILVMALFSFGAIAESSHLEQAIQHAESAAKSADGKAIAHHARMAKNQANAAKNQRDRIIDRKHLDEGIKCLDDAIKEGEDGDIDEAKQAATDAVKHFKQAIK
ncbi:small metal-binding protein SmbP [Nitrosomonas supralitoralis]|nr:small metal-binding protein SmbP [Nitrosomonas supralitoralis]